MFKTNRTLGILIFVFLALGMVGCGDRGSTTKSGSDQSNTITAAIGSSGGTVSLSDGTALTVPAGALNATTTVTITKTSSTSENGTIEHISLEPSGLTFNTPATLKIPYNTSEVQDTSLLSAYIYSSSNPLSYDDDGLEYSRWDDLEVASAANGIMEANIDHFSIVLALFQKSPIYTVMHLPGKYLQKGDLVYRVGNIFGGSPSWLPGHAAMYLGTDSADNNTNNGETYIHSTPVENECPDMFQFSEEDNEICIGVVKETNFSAFINYDTYMGARRYDGTLGNDDRITIASYALSKQGYKYSLVGEDTNDESFSCVGLTEAAYESAGKNIVNEIDVVTPLEQFINTVPVDEINVYVGEHVEFSVNGMAWTDTFLTKGYYEKIDASATNLTDGMTFESNKFSWTPGNSSGGKQYIVTFESSSNGYKATQQLKMNVVADTTAPSAPTNLSASSVIASNQIDITWTASTDDVGVAGYKIYETVYNGNDTQVGTSTTTSYSVTGLNAGTFYCYVVSAYDAAGNESAKSSSACATTSAAYSAPSGVSATAGDGQVTISWVSVSGATSYNIYWSTTSGVSKSNGTKLSNVTSPYTHTGLTNGTTYYYVVTAVNSYGESSESSYVSASPNATPAATGRMPDTNQTTSYTSTFGEDHDYTINPPSYTDNGDGTITDNVTGLVWQKQDDATKRTWADAGTYCDASTLGGYADWRLPSQIELISLIDYGVYYPSINATFFPGTSSYQYWSFTTDAFSTSYAWYVNFAFGQSKDDFKTYSYYVRCVRGGQTSPSLTDNDNGTVTDSGTLLTWQQGENSAMTWEPALTYCEGLSLAGSTDWRLPNGKELLSLVDYTRNNPSINTTLFPSAISSNYWSSTTWAYYTPYAEYVEFDDGGSYCGWKTYSGGYVRCVRGGQ